MRKLSEYKNEEALDVLADIIDPVVEILADKGISKLRNMKVPKLKLAQYVIKNHKESVLRILARLNDTPYEEFECNIFTLPMQILELLNDEELLNFFNSQGQMAETSGSVTEATQVEEA